jgi:RNA polymerase I-specific transcription initiation factor RRN3
MCFWLLVLAGYDHEESDDGQDELFDLEGLVDLELDPDSQQHQQDLSQLHDGFHDPAAFAAAGQHGARRQQQLAAAAGADGKPGKPPVDVTADKLDSMMELTMQHLQKRVEAGQLGSVWQTMLRVFEARLIHAHRCKFTQFLLFYLTVQDPGRCCSSFSACLMSMLRDSSQPAITRCACAAYLASFLARCAVAPKPLVVDVLHKLTAAAQEYADSALQAAHRHQQQQQQQGFHRVGSRKSGELKASSSDAALVLLAGLSDLMGQGPLNGVTAGANTVGSSQAGALAAIQRHQVFYAMVQALLYLLCYHMQPLLGEQQQDSSGEQQQLGQAIATLVRQQVLPLLSHPLAPLAVCHQAVTAEFVRQALMLGLADAQWEEAALQAVSQHQVALSTAASTAAAIVIGGEGAGDEGGAMQPRVLRPLEVFFPFDPYLLKRSAKFLQLPTSYMCFSHGQPHVSGAKMQGGRGAGADGADVVDDDVDDITSEDEGDWDEAAVAGGGSDSGSDGSSSSSESDGEDDPVAAAANGSSRVRRPVDGLMPVGLAAAARQQGMAGLSGPSPPPDMMATSMLSNGGYLGGVSYESADHVFGHGGSPLLGGSPMPMSITPYDGSYMQNMQAQLNGLKGTVQ